MICCGSNIPARQRWQHPPSADHLKIARPVRAGTRPEIIEATLLVNALHPQVEPGLKYLGTALTARATSGPVPCAIQLEDSVQRIQFYLRAEPAIYEWHPQWADRADLVRVRMQYPAIPARIFVHVSRFLSIQKPGASCQMPGSPSNRINLPEPSCPRKVANSVSRPRNGNKGFWVDRVVTAT